MDKKILFERSEAVAYLNRVEGFNPVELTRTIIKEGQENQLYLDVKFRKLWFRLKHPQGKIVSRIIDLKENMAVVEARVYLDKMDTEENYVSGALAQRFRTEDPNFGDKFLEMAETAAVGRALSDAGFGLQFADVAEGNDPAQVDAGIPVNNPMGQNMLTQVPQYPVMQGNAVHMPYMGNQQNPVHNYPDMPMQAPVSGQYGYNEPPVNYRSAVPMPLDKSLPVEELVRRMSYEQAVQVVVTTKGMFEGKTMGQVAVERPGDIKWFAEQYAGNNHLLTAAARVILNKALPKAV